MSIPLSIAIATRYIFGYRMRLLARFIAPIIALALSITMVILVFNVSNGMIAGIVTKFLETGIYHIRAESDRFYDEADLRVAQQELLADPFVKSVSFEYSGVGLLSANGMRQGVSVRAISREMWRDDPDFREHVLVEQGSLSLLEEGDVMIGSHVAHQIGIESGDVVEIISLNRVGDAVFPRISTHNVQGVFSVGYRDLDRLWVLLPFEHATQSLVENNLRTIVGIKITDPFSLPNPLIRGRQNAEAVSTFRNVHRVLSDDFTISSWFQFRASQFLSFRSTKNILIFIMLLIIAVAMVYIIATLNTLVLEKQTEIAYLLSLGATGKQIHLIFICCGFYIGLGGATLGTMLGLLASIHINWILRAIELINSTIQRIFSIPQGINLALLRQEFYLEQIPATFSLVGLLLIFFTTLVLAIAAALVPARKSAMVNAVRLLSDMKR